MYACLTGSTGAVCPTQSDTAWSTLKEAVRSIVAMADNQVRFGFATAWGTNPAGGGMCPSLQGMLTDNVPPAIANATAVMAQYDSLAPPSASTTAGVKFESPVSASETAVGQALGAITTPGEKYILLVTNGQADYCDDGAVICPLDSTVWRIQQNKTAGITTIVLGIQSTLFSLPSGVLQAYANAGAGEPTVAALPTGLTVNSLYDQCSGSTGWEVDIAASGKPNVRGTSLGTYSTTAGPSGAFAPTAADEATIAARFKSCTFELAGNVKVDTSQLNLAHIAIAGTEVPQDAANGWNMPTATQVVLNGTACTSWRTAGHDAISFQFPCEIILPGP
jgi:hypothetical protein